MEQIKDITEDGRLHGIYACPECKKRIAIKQSAKYISYERAYHIGTVYLCEHCHKPQLFDYIGYWHTWSDVGEEIYTPEKRAIIVPEPMQ